MSDICDVTDARLEKEEAIARKIRERPHSVSSECLDCGDAISPERQAATNGTSWCVSCVADYERRLQLGRR